MCFCGFKGRWQIVPRIGRDCPLTVFVELPMQQNETAISKEEK
jgi:hypothetical protein